MADPLREREKGDAKALCPESVDSIQELYTGYYDPLVLYLKKHFRSGPHRAEEIAQDTFEKIAHKGDLKSIGNIKAFLWRTAHNIAVSGIRSRQLAGKYKPETARMFATEEGYSLTPERVLEAREQVEIAKQTLREMPEQRRRAFILTRIKELSHTEAARIMGISRPAVSKHVAKATAAMYTALHNDSKDDTE